MRTQLLRHRRPLAVLCALVAVSLVRLPQTSPSGGHVLVAARDLTGGTRLAPQDVQAVRLHPPPSGAISRLPDGAVLAAPVRRGEPLTDLRLLGPALLDAHAPGLVAAPVRVPDAALATLVRPGDRVDVLAVPDASLPASGPPAPLATAVPVLAVPPPDGSSGALLLLAVTRPEAAALAGAPHLTLSLHPPASS
ncbi:SAF domain-containing protein [Actinocorallia sp. B10E7]|uniref:SAF domain-containing protein n=1 Tax=Actinocorallia sp. B10E7 TaxID=3153558 RepID=UPI00325DFCAF